MIGTKPDAERTLKSIEEIRSNVVKIKTQAERLVGDNQEILFVNNYDWLSKLSLVIFFVILVNISLLMNLSKKTLSQKD